MTEIIPAVLEETPEKLLEKISSIPEEAKLIHLDTLENDVWAPLDREFEVHIMGKSPATVVGTWAERGAKRIIVHSLSGIEKDGFEFGLGVELHVPLEGIWRLLPRVDFVHLMSIREIGAQGRQFEPEIFDRIRIVKENFPDMPVSVDGGVSELNFEELVKAGADRLVVGSRFHEVWQRSQMKK